MKINLMSNKHNIKYETNLEIQFYIGKTGVGLEIADIEINKCRTK